MSRRIPYASLDLPIGSAQKEPMLSIAVNNPRVAPFGLWKSIINVRAQQSVSNSKSHSQAVHGFIVCRPFNKLPSYPLIVEAMNRIGNMQ